MRNKGLYEKHLKRLLDFTLAFVGLLVLAPVMLVVAVLVRKKLGKPVIFAQLRPGLNEKIFKMYKFRTMTDERDANGTLQGEENAPYLVKKCIESWKNNNCISLFMCNYCNCYK